MQFIFLSLAFAVLKLMYLRGYNKVIWNLISKYTKLSVENAPFRFGLRISCFVRVFSINFLSYLKDNIFVLNNCSHKVEINPHFRSNDTADVMVVESVQ